MPDTSEVTLSQPVLKRLSRLQARAEGASAVVNAAQMAAQQAVLAFQEALTEECREEGMSLPAGGQGQVDVDWKSGRVTLQPPVANLPGVPLNAVPPLPVTPDNGVLPETEPAF